MTKSRLIKVEANATYLIEVYIPARDASYAWYGAPGRPEQYTGSHDWWTHRVEAALGVGSSGGVTTAVLDWLRTPDAPTECVHVVRGTVPVREELRGPEFEALLDLLVSFARETRQGAGGVLVALDGEFYRVGGA